VFGFVDETTIEVASGSGGRGAISFRREKYVPKGGPDGGDGGRGGDALFVVRRNLKTLSHLRAQRIFRAANGQPGAKRNRHGRDGEGVVVPVPPGTVIREASTGALIKDLGDDKEEWLFLSGGRGGKGNAHFKTSTHRTPRFAQPGEAGTTVQVRVEIHIIADVGFVGYPNAGKSTLLSVLTNANPKTGDYPFTTRIPNLGVLRVGDTERVLADIPGIIEGASHGAGLGLEFLKHIARTSVLAFLIDLSNDNFLEAFPVLRKELDTYSRELEKKDRLIVGTKTDLPESAERLAELGRAFPEERLVGVSALTRQGIDTLISELLRYGR